MGDKAIDARVIKKTQETLGKVITKPPMSEKILSRPTVQYMYDVLISVMRTTGKMKGLFTDTELNFENIKGSKEDKVAFFQKAVDYVSLVTGKAVAVKPSKILAGHEPERTNEFLQVLAEAARKNIDNDDYVRRVLKSDNSRETTSKKESSRSKEKDSTKSGDKGSGDAQEKDHSSDRHRSKDRSKDHSKDRGDRDKRDSEERSEKHKNRDKDRSDKHRDKDKDRDRDREHRDREHRDRDRHDKKDKGERPKDKEERSKDREERSKDKDERSKDRGERSRDRDGRSKDRDEDENDGEQHHSRHKESKAKPKDETQKEAMNRHVTQNSGSSRAARPSSARPAPPKPKKNELVHEEPVVVSGLQRPNVIIDKQEDSDDDDAFVAKEEDIMLPPDPVVTKTEDQNDNEEEDAEHGGLVKKLMESKKEQEAVQPKRTELERSGGVMDATKRKEREMITKDIELMKRNIQETTQHVHPLGRLLDLVQENLDSMQKELEMWKNEHRQNVIELQQRQSINDSSLEPLKAELREMDATIADQLDLMAAVKNNLCQNEIKIGKMLGTISKS